MPSGLSRRSFLKSGAAAAAGLAATGLPPSVVRALASTSPAGAGSLKDVEHVVILIQENRSFDHYFGTLSSVRGFDDPGAITLGTGRSVFHQPDGKNPDGYELPFHMAEASTSSPCLADLSHAWTAQHQAWNGGRMDMWLPAHRAADGDTTGPLTMGYLTRADLPFYYALADAFTICDGYHCSVFGPTNPNRLMSLSASIDPGGTKGGPVLDNSSATGSLSWTTYPEQLENAGISWMLYDESNSDTVLQLFAQYQDPTSPLYRKGNGYVPPGTFEAVAAAGQLPQVSWVLGPLATDEHPPGPPALGEDFVSRVLTALTANQAQWSKTVLFLTYDENDGLFDHVVPPTPPPGTPGEWLSVSPLPSLAGGIAGPVGLGFRVPLLVVSPFTRGGWLCGDTFDHTSLLRFLETKFGPEVPNLSAWRRASTGDLTSAFNWQVDTSVPTLPPTQPLVISDGEACAANPAPAPPAKQSVPHQEPAPARHRTGQPPAGVPDLPVIPGAVAAAAVAGLVKAARSRRPGANSPDVSGPIGPGPQSPDPGHNGVPESNAPHEYPGSLVLP